MTISTIRITSDGDSGMVAEVNDGGARTLVLMPKGSTRTRRLKTLFRQLLTLEESTAPAST